MLIFTCDVPALNVTFELITRFVPEIVVLPPAEVIVTEFATAEKAMLELFDVIDTTLLEPLRSEEHTSELQSH